jgi:type VII secretion-associated serine protease mycosin
MFVVAVGTQTGLLPGLGGSGGSDQADGAANAAQIGELTDHPAEEPPDVEFDAPDVDMVQRAEDARSAAEPETPKVAGLGEQATGDDVQPRVDPDTVLVSFDAEASDDEIADTLADAGLDGTPIGGIAAAEVQLDGQDRADVEAALEGEPSVDKVEPNHIRTATANPNDPQLANQRSRGLDAINVPAAWNVADTTSKVTVAVLDTGIDLDHPDLTPNRVAGRDTVAEDNAPNDVDGHGTMTAGIIGAATNNGRGVAGVAWNARIMPIKVLADNGDGTDADIAQGITWATDHGAKVINMSLSGTGSSATLANAVRYAINRNVVVVASAGNDGSTVAHYPAAYPGVIAVAATDAQGRFAWFSTHGSWITLAAPGINVRTTTLGAGAATSVGDGTGTSFSAPLVAGVAALVRERHTAWKADRVAAELIRTARDAGPAGVDNAYGYGIVDAAAALGVAPKAPVAPAPDRSGDAGNFVSEARNLPIGFPLIETIGYELDEDWFTFEVTTAGTYDVMVLPPAVLPDPQIRTFELDPMAELFDANGLRVGPEVDVGLPGEREDVVANLAPGRYTVRIRSWLGSAGPEPYNIGIAGPSSATVSSWASTGKVDGLDGDPVTGDFNGDGDVDVATAAGDDGITVAWNEDGTLGSTQTYGGASVPAGTLTAANLDSEPGDELISTGDTWTWDGSTFVTEPLGFSLGSSAAAGDLTGDGRVDLVDVDRESGNIRLRAGRAADAAGGSGSGTTSTTETPDSSSDASDTPDTPDTSDTTATTEAPAAAAGPWAEPTDVAVAPLTSATGVAMGDTSGDDKADLLVTDGTKVVRLVQQAGGTLATAAALETSAGVRAVGIGDVNGDGRRDVVVLHDAQVGVLSQGADGALGAEQALPAPEGNSALAASDLDGDGQSDLVVAGADGVGLLGPSFTAATTPSSRGLMYLGTSPAPYETGVDVGAHPRITFAATPDAASVTTDNVYLVDGRTGARLPGGVALDGDAIVFTPTNELQGGVPYSIVAQTVVLAGGRNSASGTFPFVTGDTGAPTFQVDATYQPFTLDLDANGYDDVFWYGPGTDPDLIWLMGPTGHTEVAASVRGTYTPLTGDFDDNGYDDIFWYAPGTAADTIWYSGAAGFTPRTTPVNGNYRPVTGDFNRNGYTDIFWYAPGTAADTLWSFGSAGKTSSSHPVSGTNYRPLSGDFNRDGYDDVFWYGPNLSSVALWRGKSSGFTKTTAPSPGGDRVARPLDSNADGYDDIFWFSPGSSLLWQGGASAFTNRNLTPIPDDARPVAGEMTGDRRDDVLAYVPGPTADELVPGSSS